MNEILDKILPYEARAEFYLIFCLVFGQWIVKIFFWDLPTFTVRKKCPGSNYWIRNDLPKNTNFGGIFGSSYITDYKCTANIQSNFQEQVKKTFCYQ